MLWCAVRLTKRSDCLAVQTGTQTCPDAPRSCPGPGGTASSADALYKGSLVCTSVLHVCKQRQLVEQRLQARSCGSYNTADPGYYITCAVCVCCCEIRIAHAEISGGFTTPQFYIPVWGLTWIWELFNWTQREQRALKLPHASRRWKRRRSLLLHDAANVRELLVALVHILLLLLQGSNAWAFARRVSVCPAWNIPDCCGRCCSHSHDTRGELLRLFSKNIKKKKKNILLLKGCIKFGKRLCYLFSSCQLRPRQEAVEVKWQFWH